MSVVEKIPTGVPGFDVISHGGIPKGRSSLIVGRSGTGKTILGLQIAAHTARQGIKTLLIAVEESADDLISTGDNLGLDLSGAIASGTLRVTDASRQMEGPMVVSGEYDISGLVHRVQAISKQHGSQVVILDSATALFSPRPPQELLRSLFTQLIHAFRRMQLSSVVLAEAAEDYGQLTTLGVEDFVCDMVVVLRNVVDGERRRRSLEINKYRGSAHYKGEFPSTITTRGLTIFPLDARERPGSHTGERYSSGSPGLDAMISGGLFRDSIVIVRGPTGSGKTMLAGQYARAGAVRGEKVVYYGFEEPKGILLRNFAAIGMPMDELERAGNLHIICRYPEAMGLEDLLVTLRMGLEEIEPALVVMDSISSIEHSSSEKGFRQFMIGLASLLREHARGALLTQTVIGSEAATHTAPYLSTIADAILALDYSVGTGDLARTLRVLKMRGSSHVTYPYRLEIAQGGLQVEPPTIRPRPSGEVHRTRAADGHQPPSPGVPERPLQGLRILLVEDFGDAREIVATILERAGAEVTPSGSSAEAMERIDRQVPDLIVADIGLPHEDGIEFIRRVRTRGGREAAVPAVALTAWALPRDRARAKDAGFQAHLVKPVDPLTLVSVVGALALRSSGDGSTAR
jgi:circadian clock protein KaiC